MSGRASSREETVRAAVGEWSKRLVTLDGRNRMLYFRELSRGTLDLSPGADGVRSPALEVLLSGEPVLLSDLLERDALPDARRRVRSLAAKAKSNFEEKGLATLFISLAFATWNRSDGHTPRAPTVMIPLRIVLEGPGADDAVLEVRGPAEINLPFVYAIRQDAETEPYPDSEERPEEFRDWPDLIQQRCAAVPGFTIDDRVFLANLEFSKLPMVVDMEQHRDALIANEVVAALAGDADAQEGLRREPDISINLPDKTSPKDEFLVCDADASQSYAVAAALRGHSLAIHGPPGTGKSQTIANLISSLAAHGKTVLFVAEKRAAIGAVTRRLEAAGCGDLVLDLHDGSARRDVARSLATSIDAVDHLLAHTTVAAHADLAVTRKKLVAHRRQMHLNREPWDLSFSELQSMLGTPDLETTGLRLSAEKLQLWTESGRREVRSRLAQWQRHTQRLDEDPTGMWSTSAIRSAEEAAASRADAEELVADLIPAVEDAYHDSLSELKLPAAAEVSVGVFSGIVSQINELSARYQPSFIENAERIAANLAPAERSASRRFISWLTDSDYRKERRNLAEFGRVDPDPIRALRDAQRLDETRRIWARWFGDRSLPRHVGTADGLAGALDRYSVVRDRLMRSIPALGKLGGFAEEDAAIRAMLVHRQMANIKAELAKAVADIGLFGLGPLLRVETEGKRHPAGLGAMAERVFAASAIDAITWQEPELATFNGSRHQQDAARFAELDAHHIETTAQRVLRLVAAGAADILEARPREAAIVRHEAGARKNRMPIRQLVGRAPNVVKALRPCWAMSPLLVSRVLPAAPDLFDVVIFDEASQVLPIDAIPSIARGPQLIVAGDPLQLPPSQFQVSDSSEDQVEQERSGRVGSAMDSESILDVMRDLMTERSLRWHYRSQDERLINFSNIHTYERSLVSFPGTNRGTGVSHVLVDGLPDTSEETASNPAVVRRVVEMILDHARDNPDESLGVIATGRRHANAITEALRVVRSGSSEVFDGFFADKGAEPFFIKIMDEAQGDERDHIVFSVGYGRNPEGDMVYRWGALTRKGGERRLNVAVTRAKRRMTVVTSMAAKDIDPTRTRSRGAALLTQYLEYAERGGESIPGRDGTPSLTRFETSVRDRLKAAGIPLKPHYGMGSLRV
ncbi:MAG: DUF4011 domain-containing protein, partial [bacterium]|nr:DUF4011 domain-containing protein [bacterium]